MVAQGGRGFLAGQGALDKLRALLAIQFGRRNDRSQSADTIYFRGPDGERLELISDPLGEMYGSPVSERSRRQSIVDDQNARHWFGSTVTVSPPGQTCGYHRQ